MKIYVRDSKLVDAHTLGAKQKEREPLYKNERI